MGALLCAFTQFCNHRYSSISWNRMFKTNKTIKWKNQLINDVISSSKLQVLSQLFLNFQVFFFFSVIKLLSLVMYEIYKSASVVVLCRPFQFSLMFARKATAYQEGSPTQVSSALTRKQYTRILRLVCDILGQFIDNGGKKFYNNGSRLRRKLLLDQQSRRHGLVLRPTRRRHPLGKPGTFVIKLLFCRHYTITILDQLSI
jgi:hypothetical protein